MNEEEIYTQLLKQSLSTINNYKIYEIKIHEKDQEWAGRPFYLSFDVKNNVYLIVNFSKKFEIKINVTLDTYMYRYKVKCLNTIWNIINFCYPRYLTWNKSDKQYFKKLYTRINKKFIHESKNFIDCEFWFYRNSQERCIIV